MAFFQVLPKYGCNFRYQRCISVQDANTFITAYYIASLVFVLVHSFFCMLELLTHVSNRGTSRSYYLDSDGNQLSQLT